MLYISGIERHGSKFLIGIEIQHHISNRLSERHSVLNKKMIGLAKTNYIKTCTKPLHCSHLVLHFYATNNVFSHMLEDFYKDM